MSVWEHSEDTDNKTWSDSEDMRDLPIGCSDFIKVRENDLLYVDKTVLIDRILSSAERFAYSRAPAGSENR